MCLILVSDLFKQRKYHYCISMFLLRSSGLNISQKLVTSNRRILPTFPSMLHRRKYGNYKNISISPHPSPMFCKTGHFRWAKAYSRREKNCSLDRLLRVYIYIFIYNICIALWVARRQNIPIWLAKPQFAKRCFQKLTTGHMGNQYEDYNQSKVQWLSRHRKGRLWESQ